jgi:hypothetical protein
MAVLIKNNGIVNYSIWYATDTNLGRVFSLLVMEPYKYLEEADEVPKYIYQSKLAFHAWLKLKIQVHSSGNK